MFRKSLMTASLALLLAGPAIADDDKQRGTYVPERRGSDDNRHGDRDRDRGRGHDRRDDDRDDWRGHDRHDNDRNDWQTGTIGGATTGGDTMAGGAMMVGAITAGMTTGIGVIFRRRTTSSISAIGQVTNSPGVTG